MHSELGRKILNRVNRQPTKSAGSARAAALADFLAWVYMDGQQFASQEGYVELPPRLLAALRNKVRAP
jgi:ABC-type phosphate transport system substrate-binding protein